MAVSSPSKELGFWGALKLLKNIALARPLWCHTLQGGFSEMTFKVPLIHTIQFLHTTWTNPALTTPLFLSCSVQILNQAFNIYLSAGSPSQGQTSTVKTQLGTKFQLPGYPCEEHSPWTSDSVSGLKICSTPRISKLQPIGVLCKP